MEKEFEDLFIVLPRFCDLESKTYGNGFRKITVDIDKGTLTVCFLGQELIPKKLNEQSYFLAVEMMNLYSINVGKELEHPFVVKGSKNYEKAKERFNCRKKQETILN